jgi:hypothetical protein
LYVQGINNNEHAGDITFILIEEISTDSWVEVSGVETVVSIDSMANWSATLVLPTSVVDESEIHRYQLVARDRHIDIDWVTIEPLEIKPHTARDGEALSQQINASKGLFVLYIIAVASLCFGVAMLVLYRRERQSQIEDEIALLEQSDTIDITEDTIAPPLGFENAPLPTTMAPPSGFENAPPPTTMAPPPGFENAPLPTTMAPPFASEATAPPPEINIPLDFSDSVFANIVNTHGIQDGAAFLSFASHYDADGNGYLRKSELEKAATDFVDGGHNLEGLLSGSSAFTDEQLLTGGWTQEQINVARETGQI